MKPSAPDYHAWLLRMWRESPYAPWRIALEDVSTSERKGFANLEALVLFLQMVYVGEEVDDRSENKGDL